MDLTVEGESEDDETRQVKETETPTVNWSHLLLSLFLFDVRIFWEQIMVSSLHFGLCRHFPFKGFYYLLNASPTSSFWYFVCECIRLLYLNMFLPFTDYGFYQYFDRLRPYCGLLVDTCSLLGFEFSSSWDDPSIFGLRLYPSTIGLWVFIIWDDPSIFWLRLYSSIFGLWILILLGWSIHLWTKIVPVHLWT